MSRITSIFAIIIALVACQPTHLSEQELYTYILDEDNGLISTKNLSPYKVAVSYKPIDLIINQYAEDGILSEDEYTAYKESFDDYYYFILSLSRDSKSALYNMQEGYGAFSEMLQTLAFKMDQHVELTTSELDTIPVADFIYPRMYGASQSTDLLFVFNREEISKDAWIQFSLDEFGLGIGNQKFRFNTEDLNNTPNLHFNRIQESKIIN